jgi:hypothetical protein
MANDKSTDSATSVFCEPTCVPTHANRRKGRRHRYKPVPASGGDGDAPILTARQYREARRRRRTAHRSGEISVDVNRGNSMSSASEARSWRRGKLGGERSRQKHSCGASPSPPPSGHSDQFVQSSSSSDCGLDSSFFPPPPLPPPPTPPPPSPPSSPELRSLPAALDPVFHEAVEQAGRDASAHTLARSHSHISTSLSSSSSSTSASSSPYQHLSHTPIRRTSHCHSRSSSPRSIRDLAHSRDSSPTVTIPPPPGQITSQVGNLSTGSSDGNSPSYLPPPRRRRSTSSRHKSPSHSPPGRHLGGCLSRSRRPRSIRGPAHSRDSSPTDLMPRAQEQATSRIGNPSPSSSDGKLPSYLPPPRRRRSPSSRHKSPSHSPPGRHLGGCLSRSRRPRSIRGPAHSRGSSPTDPIPRPQEQATSRTGNSSPSSSDGDSPSYLPPPRRRRSPSSRHKSPSHSPPGRHLGGYLSRSRSPRSIRGPAHSRDSSPTYPIPRPQKQATSRTGNSSPSSSDGKLPSYLPPPRRRRSPSSRHKSLSHSTPGIDLGGRHSRSRSPRSIRGPAHSLVSSPTGPMPRAQEQATSRIGNPSPGSSDGNSPSHLPPPRRRRSPSSRHKSPSHSPPGRHLGGRHSRSSSPRSIRGPAHSRDSSPTDPIPRAQEQATSRIGNPSPSSSDGGSPSYLPPPRRGRSRRTSSCGKSHNPPGGHLGHSERARCNSLLSTRDSDQSGNTAPSYPVPRSVRRSERRRHPRSTSSLLIQDGDSSPSYPVPRPQVLATSQVGDSSNRISSLDGGSPSHPPPRLHNRGRSDPATTNLLHKGYIVDNVSHHMSYPADLDHRLLVPFLLKKLGKTGSQFRAIALDLLGSHDGLRAREIGPNPRSRYPNHWRQVTVKSVPIPPSSLLTRPEVALYSEGLSAGYRAGYRAMKKADQQLWIAQAAISSDTITGIAQSARISKRIAREFGAHLRGTGIQPSGLTFTQVLAKIKRNRERPLALRPSVVESKSFGRSYVNGLMLCTTTVVYLTSLEDPRLTVQDGIPVLRAMVEASISPVQSDAHVDPQRHHTDGHDVSFSNDYYYYTCRVGFESTTLRDAALPHLRALVALLAKGCVHCGYERRSEEAHHYDLCVQVVPRLLGRYDLPRLDPDVYTADNPYPLLLAFWYDASRDQTAGRCWVIDTKGILWPIGISHIETFLLYVGGEEVLPRLFSRGVEGMERLESMRFQLHDAFVRLVPMFLVADHHALNVIEANVGGSSPHRGSFTHSIADLWARVPFQGDLILSMGDVLDNYDNLMGFVQREHNKYLEAANAGLEQFSINTFLIEAMQRACRHFKKASGQPLLCRTSDDVPRLRHMLHIPPSMHNANAVAMCVLFLTLTYLIPEGWPEREAWIHRLQQAEPLYAKGRFNASAGKIRALIAGFPGIFEVVLWERLPERDRRYAILPRLVTLVIAIYYGHQTATPRHELAHSCLSLASGLLTTDLSARYGGKEPKHSRDFRLHTDSQYFQDWMAVTPVVHMVLSEMDVTLRDLLEEGSERSFGPDHVAQEMTRNSKNIGPQQALIDRRESAADLLGGPKKRNASGHRTEFAQSPPLLDVVYAGCFQQMRTQPRFLSAKKWIEVDRPKYETNELPIASVAIRAFLEHRIPEHHFELVTTLRFEKHFLFAIGDQPSALRLGIEQNSPPERYCLCGLRECTCEGTRATDLLVLCCCDQHCDVTSGPGKIESIGTFKAYREGAQKRSMSRRAAFTQSQAGDIQELDLLRLAQAEKKLAAILQGHICYTNPSATTLHLQVGQIHFISVEGILDSNNHPRLPFSSLIPNTYCFRTHVYDDRLQSHGGVFR